MAANCFLSVAGRVGRKPARHRFLPEKRVCGVRAAHLQVGRRGADRPDDEAATELNFAKT